MEVIIVLWRLTPFIAFDMYDNTKDGTLLHASFCYSFLSLLKFL